MIKGIDVSTWQDSKQMNWAKIAKNVDFVIIRDGFGSSSNQIDNQFVAHMKNAIKAGIKRIGIYHFSYSRSIAEAKIEAQVASYLCQPYKDYISFIAYDWEYKSYDYCIENSVIPTRALCDGMAAAFKAEIEKSGYKFMLYTNPDYASRYFTLSRYDCLWIAQYGVKACSVKGVDLWQYTSTGRLDGYSGNLDVDICYNDKLFFDWEEKRMATLYQKGDKCIGVLAIKEMLLFLYAKGIISQKVDENGTYGAGTVEAVKQFQKVWGLKQTGSVDDETIKCLRRAIDKEFKKATPDLQLVGDVNGDGKVSMQDVTALQQHIAGFDYQDYSN